MKAIAACDRNMAIGYMGKLLCHIPGDLKYFKEKTLGTTIVMGRKTLESLPGGKPLPGRETIVLSRTIENPEGFTVAGSVDETLKLCEGREVFICGGENVYGQFIPYCDEVYLTEIDEEFEADAYFPDISADFEKVWESEINEDKGHRYRFVQYRRKQD